MDSFALTLFLLETQFVRGYLNLLVALHDHLVKDSAIVVELLLVAIKVGAQQRVVLGPLGDDGLEVRDVLLVE